LARRQPIDPQFVPFTGCGRFPFDALNGAFNGRPFDRQPKASVEKPSNHRNRIRPALTVKRPPILAGSTGNFLKKSGWEEAEFLIAELFLLPAML